MTPVALLLVRRRVVIEDAAALIGALQRDGRLAPLVVCPDASTAQLLSSQLERPVQILSYAGKPLSPTARVALAHPRSRLRSGLRNSYALRALVTAARLARRRRQMGALLRRFAPRVVIVFEDRIPDPEMALLDAARCAGIRSLLVSFAASSAESDALFRRGRVDHMVDEPPWRAVKRWLAGRFPDQIRDTPWGRMLFFAAPESLALATSGLLGGRNWHYGGGDVDLCTKIDAADLEHARAEGAAVGKYVVTGQPAMDELHRRWRDAGRIRGQLVSAYGLDPGKPIVLCAVPQAGEHGQVVWEQHVALTRELFHVLQNSGANVVLSLHPSARVESYAPLAAAADCRILRERLSEALPAADIFVATFSSTVRWALRMKIATIMVDVLGYRQAQFVGLPGTLTVKNHRELARALRELAKNAAARAALAAQAPPPESFDGRACERIVGLTLGLAAGHR